jgi:transposase InsO family protein
MPITAASTSGDDATLAEDLAVSLSSGRTGQGWDNPLAESCFASLKGECLDQQPWPTRAAARRATVEYIAWYNRTGCTAPRLQRGNPRSTPARIGSATPTQARTAVFDYLEIFHNRQCRQSSLGMLTPIQFEHSSTVA